MNAIKITTRLKLLIAVALSALTLVAGVSFYSLYVANRPVKPAYDAASYSAQVLPHLVALLTQSYRALENLATTEQIIGQDENPATQQIATALLSNYSKQTDKQLQEINNLFVDLPKTLRSAEEQSLAESMIRTYQEAFRPQLQLSSSGLALPTSDDLARRISRANLGLTAVIKDIDSLAIRQTNQAKVSQSQFQSSVQSYENMLWGTVAALMIVMVLMSWMSIEIKIALHKMLGAPPEEINDLVTQIFKSRLGTEIISGSAMPKNVKTAIIVFPETLMRLFADVKKVHDRVFIGDHQARFDLRDHHPESRETLRLINTMLDHVAKPGVETAAMQSPTISSSSTENLGASSIDAVSESNLKSEESLKQAQLLSKDLSQSIHALQTCHGVLLKINHDQHAELQYASEQTIALLHDMQRLPDRLMDAEKVCDAAILTSLAEQTQLSALANSIDIVQKNTQQVSTQLTTLENIALQGDMLSFNIAIEVARIGDEGRGFSAIGNEVRHLAERAMTQTRSIRALIADTDASVTTANETLSEAVVTNKELLDHAHRLNALTQSSVEVAHTAVQGMSGLANDRDQMETHSHEQVLLVHHQAVLSKNLEKLAGVIEHSLRGSSNAESVPTKILPPNTVVAQTIQEPTPLVAPATPSSLMSDQTTLKSKPAAASKPIADNDWSLF
jgi:methyl-accepting chemotaxis protein